MNYDFIKNDILDIVNAINGIHNINTLDAQISELNQQITRETDQEKKAALTDVITDLNKVKSIVDQLESLSDNPEEFVKEFDKVFYIKDDSKGWFKNIIAFDDAILRYNKADKFAKSTIPNSTISNVTKILEQMNQVSLMYLCVHDKVASERHREEVDNLQEKADKVNREIGKKLEPYEETDYTQLKENVSITNKNLYEAQYDLFQYSYPDAKKEFLKGYDEALAKEKKEKEKINDIQKEIDTLNDFAASLDDPTLMNEAKALEGQLLNKLNTDDPNDSTNKKMAQATLETEIKELQAEISKKDEELRQLKENAGKSSSAQLERLEKLMKNSIKRINFSKMILHMLELIPDEIKKQYNGKITISDVINHFTTDKRIPEQNLILLSHLKSRLPKTVPLEVKKLIGGHFVYVLRTDNEAYIDTLPTEIDEKEAHKDRELLDFIARLGSIESTLASVRSTEGLTDEEINQNVKMFEVLLNQMKKDPLYVHGLYEFMNLYNEKIKLATKISEKEYLADVQDSYSTITDQQEKDLKSKLKEKKREIYDYCKSAILKLPEKMQSSLLDALGAFDEAKSLEDLKKLYANVKEAAGKIVTSRNDDISEHKKLAEKYADDAYQHSEELWNKNIQLAKEKLEAASSSNKEYKSKLDSIDKIVKESAEKSKELIDDRLRIGYESNVNICSGANYFDSLAKHAIRLKDSAGNTKEEGHKDSSEYTNMVHGLERLTLMYSRTRSVTVEDSDGTEKEQKELTFGKYNEGITMTANICDELKKIKDYADAYISAKKAQWFHWIPSTMRKYRLSYAQNVMDFCESQLKILQKATFEDLDIKADRDAYYERKKKIDAAKPLTYNCFEQEIWNDRKTYIEYSRKPIVHNTSSDKNIQQQSSNPNMIQNTIMNEQDEISTSISTKKKEKQLLNE